MNNHPPKRALNFLRWFCREDYLEEIEGDLIEIFDLKVMDSPKRASRGFTWSVLKYFRPAFIKSFKGVRNSPTSMIKHNFLLTYRNFTRHRSSFLINLIGLSTGLACAFLIYLWVSDELKVDKFHQKDTQLYQAMLHHHESNDITTMEATQGLLAYALREEVPEVDIALEATDPAWFGDFVLTEGEKKYKSGGMFVGKDFFSVFSYNLKHGDRNLVLKDKNSIVLSESLAMKIFKTTENVIGKTLDWQILHFKQPVVVTGIFEDPPQNSTDQFDFTLSFDTYREMQGDGIHWGNYNSITYVVLKENTDLDQLNNKLSGFVKEKHDWSNVTLFLKPYSAKYLFGNYVNGVQSGGRIEYVRLFSIIAIFILLIACINFMNLSTAKASRRLKEVGIKKAIGVSRRALILQFLTESISLSGIAIVIALLLVNVFLPAFNEITSKELILQFDLDLLTKILAIIFITGILAGSYPAMYLSGFNPTAILKGSVGSKLGPLWTRKGLVVFQFSLSIILIVSVMVVYNQLHFVQSMNLGYDRENVIVFAKEGKSAENLELVLTELKKVDGVLNATATSHPLVESGSTTTGVDWEGKDPEAIIKFENITVGFDFLETIGADLKEGRTFSREFSAETSKIMFNEKAIEVMGLKDPVGSIIVLWGDEMEVVGVVKDFHYSSLHEEVKPMFLQMESDFINKILVKIEPGRERETIAGLTEFYKEFNPGYSLDYRFLDQDYQSQYIAEERVSVLSRYFAIIAVLISCLGLFGLAAFTAERKLKEIGIRRILGASEFRIIRLLSGEFTKMVVTAIFIALPISYLLATQWLQGFAFRIELEWWFFAGAGISGLLIAWLTVGLQTVKAARTKPTDCLKDE